VNVILEIRSYPGTITYDVYQETCVGFNNPQKGITSCSPFYSAGKYYYLQGRCVPYTETVYRYIDGESIKVWLQPTVDTLQWLGWDEPAPGKYPLRYLYPEKWALGTWTPQGFTTEGDVGLWTEEEIKKFLAEHPGYNFLKADPRHYEIPSEYLRLAEDPMGSGGRVIPLFGGGFTTWGGMGPLENGDPCMISGRGPDGQAYCAKTINNQTDPMFGSLDLSTGNITYLSISFSHIPMDIPGEWSIIAKIVVNKAIYESVREEVVDDEKYLFRMPEYGYEPKNNTFITYMWISTPCNPAEKNGCKN